jgi:hypothetical protein
MSDKDWIYSDKFTNKSFYIALYCSKRCDIKNVMNPDSEI